MGIFSKIRNIIPGIISPTILRFLSSLPIEKKIKWSLFDRPNYAYGVYYSALQASSLGLKTMSVIEFGVAGGNGLVALEDISSEIGKILDIQIQVYGFDTGEGMPPAIDYRDLPYVWKPGFFKMDVPKLKTRLKTAQLIIGNLEQTLIGFVEKYKPAPIGFISFDVDYYSSTKAAFKIFDSSSEIFLPRVISYFDDCVGDGWELHSEFTGELLAIHEFNDAHKDKKIAPIHGFQYKTLFKETWNAGMFATHLFSHPQYCQHVYPDNNWHIPLS